LVLAVAVLSVVNQLASSQVCLEPGWLPSGTVQTPLACAALGTCITARRRPADMRFSTAQRDS